MKLRLINMFLTSPASKVDLFETRNHHALYGVRRHSSSTTKTKPAHDVKPAETFRSSPWWGATDFQRNDQRQKAGSAGNIGVRCLISNSNSAELYRFQLFLRKRPTNSNHTSTTMRENVICS